MVRFRTLVATLVVGASLAFSACSDLPTAPDTQALVPQDGLLATLTTTTEESASVLRRTRPLAEDEVVSQVIGRLGGVIRLPEAGLTVNVPLGAVDGPTRITVTAPAGDLVGYEFQPHGLRFEQQVTLVQDLLSTEGAGLLGGIDLVYFDGDLEAEVTPLENLTVLLTSELGIARIEHFSGYAYSKKGGYVIATN